MGCLGSGMTGAIRHRPAVRRLRAGYASWVCPVVRNLFPVATGGFRLAAIGRWPWRWTGRGQSVAASRSQMRFALVQCTPGRSTGIWQASAGGARVLPGSRLWRGCMRCGRRAFWLVGEHAGCRAAYAGSWRRIHGNVMRQMYLRRSKVCLQISVSRRLYLDSSCAQAGGSPHAARVGGFCGPQVNVSRALASCRRMTHHCRAATIG